jgi:hypothetical protein
MVGRPLRWAAGMVAVAMAIGGAAACSKESAPPTTPTVSGTRLELTQGQTVMVPRTALRLTFENVSLPHLTQWDCLPGYPCQFGPAAWVLMAVPGQTEQRTTVFIPDPGGSDRQRYGGYTVRLVRFEPGWNAAAPLAPQAYRAVFEVTPD